MNRSALLLLAAMGACSPADRAGAPAAADTARPRAVAIPHHPVTGTPPGQTVYVPVYTDIFFRDQRRRFPLTVTLSVRNTDPEHAITVSAVQLYGTDGRFLREHLTAPLRLGPLATAEYIVGEQDHPGGSGANFLVEWSAPQAVTEPVVEAVMIGATGAQGISFVSVGRPLVRR